MAVATGKRQVDRLAAPGHRAEWPLGRRGFPAGGNAQLALPSMTTIMAATPAFAHPFERAFAHQLDALGIPWRYEPTTFVLSRRCDGAPAVCFTPDFYLPGLETYVELTSVRQALVTRKHRKLRQFRVIHPSVRVVMLYRRDYQRLISDWSLAERDVLTDRDASPQEAPRPYIDAGALAQRLDALAGQMAARYARIGERPLIVAAGEGAALFARDLALRLAALGVPPDVAEVNLVRRESGIRVRHGGGMSLAGRTVTLAVSIVSTGLTTFYLDRWLRRRGARAVEICTLLDRCTARVATLPIAYRGFEAPPAMVVGYGLCLDRTWRHLPFVGLAGHHRNARLIGAHPSPDGLVP